MEDWDSMLHAIRSHPSGMRELIEKHGATNDHQIAGVLLGVLNQVRQEGPIAAAEVNSAIFGLLRSMRVWELSPWTPEGMLNTLERAISEDGIPEDAERDALLELIERAASQDEKTSSRFQLINLGTIGVCVSLAQRGELLTLLSRKSGTREFLTQQFEAIERRFRREPGVYGGAFDDDIAYVLQVLRGEDGANRDAP